MPRFQPRPSHFSFILAALLGCASAPKPAPTSAKPAPAPQASAAPAADAEPIPLLRLPADVRPVHYALSMKLDPDAPGFSGSAEIRLHLDRPRSVIWLHGRDLKVSEASVNGTVARYEQVTPDGVAKVTLPAPVGPGEATLRVAWDGTWNQQLVGLYRGHEAGHGYAFTMFEAIDARRAFIGFDEPAFKTPYDVTLTVPKKDVAIGNTRPVDTKVEGDQQVIRFGTTKPLPTYLVAWAVGPFDVVAGHPLAKDALRPEALPIGGVAPLGRGKELAFALDFSPKVTGWLEQYFGISFPYEKLDHVAVPDFAWGAEENAGEIHYREPALLFSPGLSPDESRARIEEIMAHETSHQWFGDLVTMPWWTDTWLNESFATWMGNRSTEAVDPGAHAWVTLLRGVRGAMAADGLESARAIRKPLEHMADVINQFDGMTYQKGGGVLSMFEHYLGRDTFRAGIHQYLTAHAWGSGSTDDLLDALSAVSHRDVKPAFHSFLDQPGVPLVQAQVVCDGKPRLELSQSRYLPVGSHAPRDRQWGIPVCARFSVHGKESEACTLLDQQKGALELPGCPDWLFPNADGAGYFHFRLDPKDQAKLAQAPLTVRERIAMADDLSAAMHSSDLSFADMLKALLPLAHDPDPELAATPMGSLEFAKQQLVPAPLRPRVEQRERALYLPLMKKLGWSERKGESSATRKLRAQVVDFLAESARDPSVRAEAKKRGLAYAGLADGHFHPEAVAADLAGTSLEVAVQDVGAKLFDALLARLPTETDGPTRFRIVGALGSTRDPALAARARALSLDNRLHKNERMVPLYVQLRDPSTREDAWRFVKENFDALVGVLPELNQGGLAYMASAFCDQPHLDDASAFLTPRASKMAGGTRIVAQVLERVRLCTALAQVQQKSAEQFFSR